MINSKNFRMLITIVAISFCITYGLFAGVRQTRTANATGSQAYVNPNYSNQATTYRPGTVNTNPGQAVVGQNGTATYNGYGAVVVGGYYNDYSGYVNSAPTQPAIPIGTILEYAPSGAVPVMVNGVRYYYQDNVYLEEVFDGYAVVYQVVPAPIGAVVTQLPAGCVVQNYNGKSFTLCGGTYYQQVAGGYQVVAAN